MNDTHHLSYPGPETLRRRVRKEEQRLRGALGEGKASTLWGREEDRRSHVPSPDRRGGTGAGRGAGIAPGSRLRLPGCEGEPGRNHLAAPAWGRRGGGRGPRPGGCCGAGARAEREPPPGAGRQGAAGLGAGAGPAEGTGRRVPRG